MYFLYILCTASNDLYIGVTQDLFDRVHRHAHHKGSKWTQDHPNAELVYREEHPDLSSARKRENQLKKWSRAKKEALIAGDLQKLKELSRCRTPMRSEESSA
jgi:putative endonuclease